MRALIERGRAAWPQVAVDPDAFAEHVKAFGEASLDDLHAEDLWLAFAAGQGNDFAISALDRELANVVVLAVARLRNKVSPDDVAQLLREKLLVTKSGPPKILEYSGRGPLAGFMRIAAIRLALSSTRRGDAAAMVPVSREMLLEVPDTLDDPELEHFRTRYASDFKLAFESALADLTAEERNLLRLSLVDGLTIDEIGSLFNVHRATAARRLERARDSVQQETRRILSERLKVTPSELRSILGVIRSQLDLSIQRLLADEQG